MIAIDVKKRKPAYTFFAEFFIPVKNVKIEAEAFREIISLMEQKSLTMMKSFISHCSKRWWIL